jgi:putative solute:sodium symporter small subunit
MSEPVSTADHGDFDDGGGTAGGSEGASSTDTTSANTATEETSAAEGAYWRENIRLLVSLMAVWFAVSFGCGILLRDWLDQFSLGGYPLGFWFAQQGSIYVFIGLIVFYVVRMKQIERKYDLDD